MSPKDRLIALPDRVAAALLQALASIDDARNHRLVLQRPETRRPPCTDRDGDYRVLWRGRPIGRIWQHDYTNHPWTGLGPWHWYWRMERGLPEVEGHAETLEAAMADFRKSWDATEAARSRA